MTRLTKGSSSCSDGTPCPRSPTPRRWKPYTCNYDGQLQLDLVDGVQALLDKSPLQQKRRNWTTSHVLMLETIHEYAGMKKVTGERRKMASSM